MFARLTEFVKNLNKTKTYLLLANVGLILFLIILNNAGIIPLRTGDFIFFALIMLAFALYRPGWAFLIFAGTIILENVNLAPENFEITVRPYQFIGALTIGAILIRFLVKRLNFRLDGWKWHDGLIIILNISSFFSLINSPEKLESLKLAVVLASFSALYFLTRIYIKTTEDLKKVIPFFLGSSMVVVLYGIWQNIIYLNGGNGFEVMPGRPNATFMEADWLGGFLVLLMASIYAIAYYCHSEKNLKYPSYTLRMTILHIFLIFIFILLILTVSRSAWLGAFAATFIFLFAMLFHSERSARLPASTQRGEPARQEESRIITTENIETRSFTTFWMTTNPKNWQWKLFFKNLVFIAGAGAISLAAVYIFHLTNFQLFNRAQSTGTGLQKITVSCGIDTDKLGQYGCRHINLEDIEKEKKLGNVVMEIYRDDPNINIRQKIYRKSWEQIKNHPILGIGWGSIDEILGRDERGETLNSSNIFLEIWLGAGFAGLLSFIAILAYTLFRSIAGYYYARSVEQMAVSIFIISSWFGLIVFNFFNAGIFLGFLWVWLAVSFCHPRESGDPV